MTLIIFVILCQVNQCTLKVFGTTIRKLREDRGFLLRQVAAELDIDTTLLSKVECGERNLRKNYLPVLAKFLDTDEDKLIALWLSEQIYAIVSEEKQAFRALELVTNRIINDIKTL